MNKTLSILILSISLLSCKKEIQQELPSSVQEAKLKLPTYPYSVYYELYGQPDKCTGDTVNLTGTLYYNSSFSQTTTLYTSDYSATYDSLTAIGTSGRVYKVTGVRIKHLEADVDGDALTLRVLNDYREIHLKAVGSKNDYISTSTSKLGEATIFSETCK